MPCAEMFVISTFEALMPGRSELILFLLDNLFPLPSIDHVTIQSSV